MKVKVEKISLEAIFKLFSPSERCISVVISMLPRVRCSKRISKLLSVQNYVSINFCTNGNFQDENVRALTSRLKFLKLLAKMSIFLHRGLNHQKLIQRAAEQGILVHQGSTLQTNQYICQSEDKKTYEGSRKELKRTTFSN